MRLLPRNLSRASRSWGWTRTRSIRMAAPSPSGIPLAPVERGSWCILHIEGREGDWRHCASAAAWAALWWCNALERKWRNDEELPTGKTGITRTSMGAIAGLHRDHESRVAHAAGRREFV